MLVAPLASDEAGIASITFISVDLDTNVRPKFVCAVLSKSTIAASYPYGIMDANLKQAYNFKHTFQNILK